MHSMSFKVGNVCFTILFNGAYFLSAVMVERDESNQLRMVNLPVLLAGYWPLLTALMMTESFHISLFEDTLHVDKIHV